MNTPDSPEDCPICHRIESRIRESETINSKLTSEEIEHLVMDVKNAVFKKSNVSRGIEMSDEKIILNKANFDEVYEAQKYILLLVEKAIARMEKHDAILASFGAQLADVIAKAEAFELDVEDEEMGEGQPEENELFSAGDEAPVAPVAPGAPGAPMAPAAPIGPPAPAQAPAGCPPCDSAGPAPMAPMAPEAPIDMMGKSKEYLAGYNMAMADSVRKNGVPVNGKSYEYPEFGAKRPVSAQDANQAAMTMEKSLSMKELAALSPQKLTAKLREMGV